MKGNRTPIPAPHHAPEGAEPGDGNQAQDPIQDTTSTEETRYNNDQTTPGY